MGWKLLIASDIHGSAYWCSRLMEQYRDFKPDRLVLLGDLLYHGPRNALPDAYDPKAVIEMLNPLAAHILCVRGNCDSEVDQMVLDFPIMSESGWIETDGMTFYLTHGHHLENDDLKYPQSSAVLYGHTHVVDVSTKGQTMYLNPGSVSIPKAGSPHSCVRFSDQTFSFCNLETNEIYKSVQVGTNE